MKQRPDKARRERQTQRVARAIRLLRLLEDGLYPIDELERKLAVCARTIYRDLAILKAAGVPVECRGGLYGIA